MTKKIMFARFHQTLSFPGGTNFGDRVPSESKTIKDLNMSLEDGFLSVTGVLNGINLSIMVPAANIAVMTFVSEEIKATRK